MKRKKKNKYYKYVLIACCALTPLLYYRFASSQETWSSGACSTDDVLAILNDQNNVDIVNEAVVDELLIQFVLSEPTRQRG